MECPYCKNEMKSGRIITAVYAWPYCLEDGKERRSAGEAVTGMGNLPGKSNLFSNEIESAYCPQCQKIIIDNVRLG